MIADIEGDRKKFVGALNGFRCNNPRNPKIDLRKRGNIDAVIGGERGRGRGLGRLSRLPDRLFKVDHGLHLSDLDALNERFKGRNGMSLQVRIVIWPSQGFNR